MNRLATLIAGAIATAVLLAFAGTSAARDLLVRNATVHTATSRGTDGCEESVRKPCSAAATARSSSAVVSIR